MGGSETPFGNGTYIPDPLAQFLGRVVPWSGADPPDSYVNIHAFGGTMQMPYRGGGRAFASMAEYGEIQNFLGWLNRIEAEVFVCISSKSQHDGVKGRQRRASRKREHVHLLRSLVLDLDVKPTGYPSQAAALAALLPFLDEVGLKPGPIVSTGWGLHAYIVLDQAIPRTVWQPLADRLIEAGRLKGLKFDVGVTRDANRVLRLPGSFNRKVADSPKECRVLSLGTIMTLAEVTAALSEFPLTSGVSHSPRAAVIDPAVLPPRPPIRGPEANRALANLAAARVVTSIDLLRTACPVVADSERRGGDGDLEPLWFELAKLCHYVQDGRDYFHDLSSEDARYEPEQTDAKYDIAEPQGWPACATIARASTAAAAICRTCQFNGQGQSPINFATRGLSGSGAPPVTKMNGSVNGHSAVHLLPEVDDTILLPDGFVHTPDHYIVDGDGLQVFRTQIHSMKFIYRADGTQEKQAGIEFCISQGTSEADDRVTFVVPNTALKSDQNFAEHCYGHGLMYENFGKRVKPFMTAWVTQVQQRRDAQAIGRMGWIKENSAITRFAFNGRNDPDFKPKGTLDRWKKGAGYFVGKGCTEMEVLLAASIGATLIPFTGVDGVVVHARAPTGRGKTAALETSATVWMARTMVVNSETVAHTRDRIAVAHNLPVFNDEFIANPTKASIAKFGEMILNITSGREHGRMQRSQNKSRGIRFSQTMLITAANFSLVRSTSRETTAQAARVLEIELSDAISKLGIRQDQILEIKDLCDDNHGTAGVVIADYLTKNHDSVRQAVGLYLRKFQEALRTTEGERFWLAGAAAIMVGAIIAKNLQLLDFDIVSMEKFLLDLIRYQRSQLIDIAIDTDNPVVLLDRVAEFVNQRIGNIIFTKRMHKQGTSVVETPHNSMTIRSPYAGRIAVEDKLMLLSESEFSNWSRQNDHDYHQMRRLLIKTGYCRKPKNARKLGGGTNLQNPPASEAVLEFDLSKPENARFLNVE